MAEISLNVEQDIMRDRYRGALLGLAAGDALGTTVEFRSAGTFSPVTDVICNGPFSLKPGDETRTLNNTSLNLSTTKPINSTMLRKILVLTVATCMATLLIPSKAMAWGGGSWNRSGSASYTGRYGNTYSRSWSGSGSGYHYGGYGGGYHYGGGTYSGYHYGGGGYYGDGGGYYGGGFRPGSFLAGYASGVYNSQYY